KTHQTQYYQGFSLPKITFIGLNSGLSGRAVPERDATGARHAVCGGGKRCDHRAAFLGVPE
ncbi:MAG: hypothetical protein ACP5VQ_03040, partial [Phycisphaerae bacterium]